MKKSLILLLGAALSLGPIASAAEVAVSTVTSGGTITEFTPGSAITVRTETATAPTRYVVGESVTYVDEAGVPVAPDIIRSGVPVTVHYVKEGDRMIARRVVVKKTTTTTTAPVAVERTTTTTAPVIEERRTTTTTAPAPVVEERRTSTTTTTTSKARKDDDD
jgi:hypothetical protein